MSKQIKGQSDSTGRQQERQPNATTAQEHTRTGMSPQALKAAFHDNLFYTQGRLRDAATVNDLYQAMSYTIRDRVLRRMNQTAKTYKENNVRTVSYLSAEYLLGPHLGNNVMNLGIEDAVVQVCNELGINIQDLIDVEEEPGLGNGGLGRLAACFMDSLATLEMPAIGYGIRYEFGIFDQEIRDGWQVEITDNWLHAGNPWEIRRAKLTFGVKLGGHTEHGLDEHGTRHVRWVPAKMVNGVAYDTPILGHKVHNANLLRLWKAEAPESFDFQAFNTGDYYRAVNEKIVSENLTKVLYPNDEPDAGKLLRLAQQYFFCSCSLQDLLRMTLQSGTHSLSEFHTRWVVQLNDTHPAIAVAELMRLLVDDHGMGWDEAWKITVRTFAYTNHTLLPEALEKWPVDLFRDLLPRHYEIICEINFHFLEEVRHRFPLDSDKLVRMSIIDETGKRYVRMAHLACVGSFAINGVAELHSELVKSTILRDFFELWPDKFHNVTNGVTPRRFMNMSNPALRTLINRRIGNDWVTNLTELRRLEPLADDRGFQRAWRECKRINKRDLALYVQRHTGFSIDPDTMFDIMVKRIHEYKRQHLNVLHIIAMYQRLKMNPGIDMTPRTCIFGGKAAPGYRLAKLIIKLINSVADIVNHDPEVRDRLKVVFFPNFNVKTSHLFYPAADLSEQISTAGKEASGTGNMKFGLNGALTIGTPDGANIEIREEVGEENFFQFGMTAAQVERRLVEGYRPRDIYESNDELRDVIDMIQAGFFSRGDTDLFRPLTDSLLGDDPYLVLADYQSYVDCQGRVAAAYRDQQSWTRMSILNTARMGKFSSDRAIRDYSSKIWQLKPLPVNSRSLVGPRMSAEEIARTASLNKTIRA